jgi:hypothetical protein
LNEIRGDSVVDLLTPQELEKAFFKEDPTAGTIEDEDDVPLNIVVAAAFEPPRPNNFEIQPPPNPFEAAKIAAQVAIDPRLIGRYQGLGAVPAPLRLPPGYTKSLSNGAVRFIEPDLDEEEEDDDDLYVDGAGRGQGDASEMVWEREVQDAGPGVVL